MIKALKVFGIAPIDIHHMSQAHRILSNIDKSVGQSAYGIGNYRATDKLAKAAKDINGIFICGSKKEQARIINKIGVKTVLMEDFVKGALSGNSAPIIFDNRALSELLSKLSDDVKIILDIIKEQLNG